MGEEDREQWLTPAKRDAAKNNLEMQRFEADRSWNTL